MARLPLVSFLLSTALPIASGSMAAESSAPRGENFPAAAPRAILAERAAGLAAAAATSNEPASPLPTESPDLRETDKPRNTIVRLPEFVVRQEKPRPMPERELLTREERVQRALKRYPGLRFGSFWIFSNDGIALMMAAEEERLEKKREMGELIRLLPAEQQKELKPLVERAFMREPSSSR